MPVRGVGPRHLTRQLVDRDELLGPRRQVLELDLAVRELVTHDHREMRLVAGGRLQLLPELPMPELGPRRHAAGS